MPRVYVSSSYHRGMGDLSDPIKQCSLTWPGSVWEISKKYPVVRRGQWSLSADSILFRMSLCLALAPPFSD